MLLHLVCVSLPKCAMTSGKCGPAAVRRVARWRAKLAAFCMTFGACCAFICGCGESGPQKYLVTGKVTHQGQPVSTGTVMFVSEQGVPASGPITDGSYRLKAVAGDNRVGITAMLPPPPNADPATYVAPPPLVPTKYNRPHSSGLTAQVRPVAENTIDFALR